MPVVSNKFSFKPTQAEKQKNDPGDDSHHYVFMFLFVSALSERLNTCCGLLTGEETKIMIPRR